MPATTEDPLLTTAEIAAHSGATEATVRIWIRQGDLVASRHGGRIGYRIRQSDYTAFLRRRTLIRTISGQLLTSASRPGDA